MNGALPITLPSISEEEDEDEEDDDNDESEPLSTLNPLSSSSALPLNRETPSSPPPEVSSRYV